jgi:hypothetical protein
MRDFGEWMNSMANSIEDASEFSKDMPSNATNNNNVMQDCWYKAIQSAPIPVQTEDDVKEFLDVFTEAFYDYIDWNTWNDADSDKEAVEYFTNLKNKIFGIKE